MTNKSTLSQRFCTREMVSFEKAGIEKLYEERKKKLFKKVKGIVLEIGPGTGVNLKYYPKKIKWIGIEPNPGMHKHLREKAEKLGLKVDIKVGTSERLGVEDNSVDSVVSTLVLCSVKDLPRTLKEIRRVLKPKGKFLFVEHVVDKKRGLRRSIQKAAPHTPWKFFSDGCNPGRDIAKEIKKAGFSKVEIENYTQKGKGPLHWIIKTHISGYAVK